LPEDVSSREVATDRILPAASGQLPWERIDGAAEGAGICLSGGGIRAACFSFGVLQVLQERRGLLCGPESARCLAAVSGGSYIAASYMLGASSRAREPAEYASLPPLAEGSPEEAHILSRGDYLRGFWLSFLCLAIANFAALLMLFVWTGLMIADFALFPALVSSSDFPGAQLLVEVATVAYRLPLWTVACVALLGWFTLVLNLYAEGWRIALQPIGLLLLVVTLGPVLYALAQYPLWWDRKLMLGLGTGFLTLLVVLAGLTYLALRSRVVGPVAYLLNAGAILAPRLFGLGLLAWTAIWWHLYLSEALAADSALGLLLFLATLLGGLLFSHVPHRASLHREYRSRLESCFGVSRESGAALKTTGVLLSELTPPQDPELRFPRLLVCATANVRKGGASFLPFVISHDVCGVPGLAGAAFPTDKLEFIRAPAGLLTWKKEPLLSLFTGVATTGAAVSPSMGRYTLPSVRALLAAMNVRLGRWLPNPFRMQTQRAVLALTGPGSPYKRRVLGPGYDELVAEMLNLYGPRLYVSDGAHYDNLGLLALLRARCAEIWCVDASAEPGGEAQELQRVLAIAREKMDLEIDIDLNRFAAGPTGLKGATHAIGEITYAGGATGRLIVVKLGLTNDSPAQLREYSVIDRPFPNHSTLHQVYDRRRMDAYRMLGRDSALRCVSEAVPL
jgi:hypothetical protein